MRNAFIDIMALAKFHLNRLMLTLIFGIWASELPPPPQAWQTTEKAGPDRVKSKKSCELELFLAFWYEYIGKKSGGVGTLSESLDLLSLTRLNLSVGC